MGNKVENLQHLGKSLEKLPKLKHLTLHLLNNNLG